MYEEKIDTIERLRARFDREIETRSPSVREVASEYLDSLTDYVRSYNEGPAGDPRTARVDTTGQLAQVERNAEWAEQERHRVRRLLDDVA